MLGSTSKEDEEKERERKEKARARREKYHQKYGDAITTYNETPASLTSSNNFFHTKPQSHSSSTMLGRIKSMFSSKDSHTEKRVSSVSTYSDYNESL